MERYERLERVEAKGPRDVVTEVDHLCERLVMDGVHERYPNDHFLAEEIGEVPAPGRLPSGRIWIVDPLDGTVNYANGIPFFCVSIALVADGRPVVGVVHDPTRAETFAGAIDGPALRNGHPIRVGEKELLETWWSPWPWGARDSAQTPRGDQEHSRPPLDGIGLADPGLCRLRQIRRLRPGCGTLRLDVAAAGLIAERSGARVTSLDGSPWFDLSRPAKTWSCLAAAPLHHAAMLGLLGASPARGAGDPPARPRPAPRTGPPTPNASRRASAVPPRGLGRGTSRRSRARWR